MGIGRGVANDMKDEAFDWDDFMRDTLEASVETAGGWLRCLYKMRAASPKGRISMRLANYAILFGKLPGEARDIIREISDLGIGNLIVEQNGNFTLENRRMMRLNGEQVSSNKSKVGIDIEMLKTKPAYSHIDVDREFGKAQTWCEANRKECTPRFFVNWLNRIDKPLVKLRTVGRGEQVPEPQCKACNDSGEISQQKAGTEWQFEFVPCPDCKRAAA